MKSEVVMSSYTPKFGTRKIEIEIENDVYHQLMADKKHNEDEVKKLLSQDIDFIYNYMRQEWNHKHLPIKRESVDKDEVR